jgi:NTE family protein
MDATVMLPSHPGLRRRPLLGLVCLWLLATGCAGFRAVNSPLKAFHEERGYGKQHAKRLGGEVLLALAFSGGGTRAAALSYGVLEELRDTVVVVGGERKRLLDEVDAISSVSGGSFTSAYYGLYGDRIFEDFEQRFLKRNVQKQLLLQLLRPKNWFRMMRTFFSRTELAIEYYDQKIFNEATYADLAAAAGPLIQVNATDLSVGNRFTFVQRQFDMICSDLSTLKVARAVAASSAVPVVFPALTLRNYAGTCGYVRPPWLDEALQDRRGAPRRFYNARIMQGYLDAEKRRYIHLVDGGISDNLGVRTFLDAMIAAGGAWDALRWVGIERPRHIVFIVVNAEVNPDQGIDMLASTPSVRSIVSSISGVQIHRYNFETLALLRSSMEQWAKEFPLDERGQRVRFHLVELAFDFLEDPEERRFFNNLPTSFDLPDETVDRLRDAARRLLRESEDFRRLLAVLRPPGPLPLTGTALLRLGLRLPRPGRDGRQLDLRQLAGLGDVLEPLERLEAARLQEDRVVAADRVAQQRHDDGTHEYTLGSAEHGAAGSVGPAEPGEPGAPPHHAAEQRDDADGDDAEQGAADPGGADLADAALGHAQQPLRRVAVEERHHQAGGGERGDREGLAQQAAQDAAHEGDREDDQTDEIQRR